MSTFCVSSIEYQSSITGEIDAARNLEDNFNFRAAVDSLSLPDEVRREFHAMSCLSTAEYNSRLCQLYGFKEENRKVCFYDREQAWYCFTNFAETPFTAFGKRFKSGEHFYQCCKTEVMSKFKWLFYSESPSQCRSRAQTLGFSGTWDRMKYMYLTAWYKFNQPSDATEKLISTGQSELYEQIDDGKPAYRYFWGVNSGFEGKNYLGKLLMLVRCQLIARDSETYRCRHHSKFDHLCCVCVPDDQFIEALLKFSETRCHEFGESRGTLSADIWVKALQYDMGSLVRFGVHVDDLLEAIGLHGKKSSWMEAAHCKTEEWGAMTGSFPLFVEPGGHLSNAMPERPLGEDTPLFTVFYRNGTMEMVPHKLMMCGGKGGQNANIRHRRRYQQAKRYLTRQLFSSGKLHDKTTRKASKPESYFEEVLDGISKTLTKAWAFVLRNYDYQKFRYVGKVPGSVERVKYMSPLDFYRRTGLIHDTVLDGKYVLPEVSHRGEMESLHTHMKFRDGHNACIPPTEEEKEFILACLNKEYKTAHWTVPADFMEDTHLSRVMGRIKKNSSPGYPFYLEFPTNGAMFDSKGIEMPQLDAFDSLMGTSLQVSKKMRNRKATPEMVEFFGPVVRQNLSQNTADPIRLFIKRELMPCKKLLALKWRLIQSVSVRDAIIDSLIFGTFCDTVTDNHNTLPCKTGWAPDVGMTQDLYDYLNHAETFMATDKSSWDWSCHEWMFPLYLEVLSESCDSRKINPDLYARWRQAAESRFSKVFGQCHYVLSNGMLFQQVDPGLMKTGMYITLNCNSICNSMCHHLALFRLRREQGKHLDVAESFKIMCNMGDDTIHEGLPDEEQRPFARWLESTGAITKDVYNVPFKDVTFCSAHFHKIPLPPSLEKYKSLPRELVVVAPDDLERSRSQLLYSVELIAPMLSYLRHVVYSSDEYNHFNDAVIARFAPYQYQSWERTLLSVALKPDHPFFQTLDFKNDVWVRKTVRSEMLSNSAHRERLALDKLVSGVDIDLSELELQSVGFAPSKTSSADSARSNLEGVT